MKSRLDAAIAEAIKGQRQNHAHVKRLVGLLDLEPPLAAEAFRASVEEELADQNERGRRALEPLLVDPVEAPAARAAFDLLVAGGRALPREELAPLLATAPAKTASILGEILARCDRFEARVEWLLRPSTPEQLQQLDPWEHRNQIYHSISYNFRVEQKLFAVLFELAPVMVPYSSLMFASTGEFTLRGFRRINDTVMFFSNMIEWGLDSKRGREAVARVNEIHGRYSLPNELFRFILSGIMFIPLIWNERLGWRRFTEVERLGWFHNFVEMGRAMNIQGLTDDFEEMRRWWLEMVERAGETSGVGQKVFHEIVIQVLSTYPADLRRPLLQAIISGMPDEYRQVLDIPPTPEPARASVREALRFVGLISSQLPRVPWVRSLQLHPLYRKPAEIGVNERSPLMPKKPGTAGEPNEGFPTQQRPLTSASDLPRTELPEISREELARHAREDDAWLAIHGYVYDVTRFLHDHPGGSKVLVKHLGGDGSAAFTAVGHSHGALIMMANFRIGRLAGAPVTELTDPAAPGGRIHTGRRAGRPKQYTAQDFEGVLDYFDAQTRLYDQARLRGALSTDRFPIDLPVDPRVKGRKTTGD